MGAFDGLKQLIKRRFELSVNKQEMICEWVESLILKRIVYMVYIDITDITNESYESGIHSVWTNSVEHAAEM